MEIPKIKDLKDLVIVLSTALLIISLTIQVQFLDNEKIFWIAMWGLAEFVVMWLDELFFIDFPGKNADDSYAIIYLAILLGTFAYYAWYVYGVISQ